jgi:hypothetical protein
MISISTEVMAEDTLAEKAGVWEEKEMVHPPATTR